MIVYSTFIVLYATETLSYIYDYFYWHLEWHHFVWSEGMFLLDVILLWIVASLPASILRVITSPDRTKEVLKKELSELYKLFLVPVALVIRFYSASYPEEGLRLSPYLKEERPISIAQLHGH